MSQPSFEPEAVYWLGSDDASRLPEIIGEVRYEEGELQFQGTERPHALAMAYAGGDAASGQRFRGDDGRSYVVRRLDLPTFERVFRPLVHAPPRFTSEAELTAFYLKLLRSDPY